MLGRHSDFPLIHSGEYWNILKLETTVSYRILNTLLLKINFTGFSKFSSY